jgi:hypothetical protein
MTGKENDALTEEVQRNLVRSPSASSGRNVFQFSALT